MRLKILDDQLIGPTRPAECVQEGNLEYVWARQPRRVERAELNGEESRADAVIAVAVGVRQRGASDECNCGDGENGGEVTLHD